MTEPMTDAEMDGLRSNIFAYNRKERPRLMLSGQNVIRLLARLDAAETARDAALARALPEPVLMETVEEVEALPEGDYMVTRGSGWFLCERFDGWWLDVGGERTNSRMVGTWIIRLPDLPTPTEGETRHV